MIPAADPRHPSRPSRRSPIAGARGVPLLWKALGCGLLAHLLHGVLLQRVQPPLPLERLRDGVHVFVHVPAHRAPEAVLRVAR